MNPITKPTTLVELLRWRAEFQSNKVAYRFLVDGEQQEVDITYGELDRQARAIAASLQEVAKVGERVLLLYPAGCEYVTAFLGCLYAGVIAVPLYSPEMNRLERSLPRLKSVAEDAQASVALTTTEIKALFESNFSNTIDKNIKWIATDKLEEGYENSWRCVKLSSEQLAYLLYTSGSTGTPKGVIISHGNILHNLSSISQMCGHNSESIHVSWLPIFHDFGLIVALLEPFYTGFLNIFMSPANFLQRPYRWLWAISRYKATTAGGPNFAYELCVRKINVKERETLRLSNWTNAINGAEPIRYETLERFVSLFEPCGFRREAFNPSYGMTQATASVTFIPKSAPPLYYKVKKSSLEQNKVVDAELGSKDTLTLVGCGHSLPNQQILIVNPQTKMECPSNEVGEIWISGPSVGQGYWRRTEETEQFFKATLGTGEAHFLRTEDLGFIKDTELFITGRLKDLIIIRGLNHYPQDIELTVEKSNPFVRAGCCAAFSIDLEEEEKLVVVAEAERRYTKERREDERVSQPRRLDLPEISAFSPELDQPLDTKKLIGDIRQSVAQQHELKVYRVILIKAGTIPKTSSGKIQHNACRTAFLSGKLDILAKG